MAPGRRPAYHERMPKVQRLGPYNAPPGDVGTVIVSEGPPGKVEVRIITERGSQVIWPFRGAFGRDLQSAIDYALSRVGPRDTIYVEGDLDI